MWLTCLVSTRMKVSRSEVSFRHALTRAMEGQWRFVWHEDKEISPGVPDLMYCFESDGFTYESGWLELKSKSDSLSGSNKIGVEPSQHQYIRRWRHLTPIHFLIHIKGMVYLVSSEHHSLLPMIDSIGVLASISIVSMRKDEMQHRLATTLKNIVRRHSGGAQRI